MGEAEIVKTADRTVIAVSMIPVIQRNLEEFVKTKYSVSNISNCCINKRIEVAGRTIKVIPLHQEELLCF
jgi:hypothetical protein